MSFVICCATSEYGVITTDGRVVDYETESVIQEDFKKVIRVSDDVIVGFAGMKDFAVNAVNYAIKKNSDKIATVENISSSIQSITMMAKFTHTYTGKTVFYVLGKSHNGYLMYTLVTDGEAKQITPTSGTDMRISCCGCSLEEDPIPMCTSS